MPDTNSRPVKASAAKFSNADFTASGAARASVALKKLTTVWFNTGTLCNIACDNCYIESSPTNDRLAYLSSAEVATYLDEIEHHRMPVREIAFTGGEPFMNPDIVEMLEQALGRGFHVLVLTNAMKPMSHRRSQLLALRAVYADSLVLRVSIDHYRREQHEAVRGPRTWEPMIDGLRWLSENGFNVHVAGRTLWNESEERLRAGYGALFQAEAIGIDAGDPASLVLFPEMNPAAEAPEISVQCWDILGVRPEDMMCAASRMVIKRKDAARPLVVPCTLLPYDPQFELGTSLVDATRPVKLNHPFCAQFCVLGGGSCSDG